MELGIHHQPHLSKLSGIYTQGYTCPNLNDGLANRC